jgi:phage-related protein
LKVNNIDIRKYGAKQLTADVQPPSMDTNYEWITRALLPMEFQSDVQMGHLKLSVYFRGKDRNDLIRQTSNFMKNFRGSCDLELDGYQGTYKGYITSDDYEKKSVKDRYVVNLEFDGFFFDDEIEINLMGKTEATICNTGTRDAPCVIEVVAESTISNLTIKGLSDEAIIIEQLDRGSKLIIDGRNGIVTMNGKNAFEKVNIWEFPRLKAGDNLIVLSSASADVAVKYNPMWI